MEAPRTLEVHLLGGFRVVMGGQPIPATAWRRKRAAAVVKLLALEAMHRLHREQLTDALWPELDPDDAANNLRVALHHARQRLHAHGSEADAAGAFLDREGDVISLGPSERVRVDVDDFEDAVRRAWQSPDPARSEVALAEYGGDLLPEDLYEDWASGRRATLRASYLTLLRRLAQLYENRAELGQAIATWHRLLAAEPLDEDAHADLIRLLAQVGQPHQASEQHDVFAALLEREIGVDPQPATRELIAAIRDGRFPHAAQPLEPATADEPLATERPHGLPSPVDDLIGREREVAELRHLLATARLVTLTGPGGVGKTRLGLATAHATQERFPDGAYFADLAPLEGPGLVLPTIARALGVREEAGEPLVATVADHVGERRVLLLVDNMEHVSAAATDVSDLLASCPGLKALVTSRGRLKLHGEHEYLVQPLPMPDVAVTVESGGALALPSTALSDAPAVALFVRRASAARREFCLTGSNAAIIADICRRLDGLPLAIELAAARVRVLPPAELLARLAQPLSVLTDGPRDAPDRQRTLRATIGWSYDLLSTPEQDLFARLSVFAGGFTLEAAERVSGVGFQVSGRESDPRHPTPDTFDLVASLVDHSLVRQTAQPDGIFRLRMLETIREYARERLEFSGEADEIRGQHARFFLALAQSAEPELTGPDQGMWLDRLETDHDNLRQALTSFRDMESSAAELRLAAALWRFWWQRGYFSEGRAWLEHALAHAADVSDPAIHGDARDGAGALAEAQGDLDTAALHHEAALDLRRKAGDRGGEVRSLTDLGIVADKLGMPERAVQLFEEGIALARAADDPPRLAACLANLGFVSLDLGNHQRAAAVFRESLELFRDLSDQRNLSYVLGGLSNLIFLEGDYTGAAALQEESLRVLREIGDHQGIADATADLGHAVQRQGDLDRAEELYTEARRRYQELGDRSGTAFSLLHLGRLAHQRGDAGRAEALLRESLHMAALIGDKQFETEAIEGLAGVTCDRGDVALCARLLGVAEVLRETTGIALPTFLQPELDRCVATARSALGEAGFAAARGEGRALTPEQVLLALAASGAS